MQDKQPQLRQNFVMSFITVLKYADFFRWCYFLGGEGGQKLSSPPTHKKNSTLNQERYWSEDFYSFPLPFFWFILCKKIHRNILDFQHKLKLTEKISKACNFRHLCWGCNWYYHPQEKLLVIYNKWKYYFCSTCQLWHVNFWSLIFH